MSNVGSASLMFVLVNGLRDSFSSLGFYVVLNYILLILDLYFYTLQLS